MSDLEAFRSDVRSFLESAPKSMRGRLTALAEMGDEDPEAIRKDRKRWLEVMDERGYHAPMWPTEYGGGGVSPKQARVLQEEMAKLKLPPPLLGMGLTMIGPTLLVHGTEEQKREYLPKIVTGEHRWCQGFSEPGAG